MPSTLAVAWLLIATAACGGSASNSPTTAQPVAPGVWVVLGSSSAAGVGAPSGQGWVARLEAAQQPAGVTVNNLARSGLLTNQAMPAGSAVTPNEPPPDPTANIDRALQFRPKLVILAFPSNDAMAGVAPPDTVGRWQTIRQRALQGGAATLVLSTQPRNDADAVQRAALAESDRLAAAAFGPCFVALHAALSDAQGNIAPTYSAGDGVHLNAQGHRVVFERVSAVLAGGGCVRVTG